MEVNKKLTTILARISLPFVSFFLAFSPSQAYALVAPPAQLAVYGLPDAGAAVAASGGAGAAAVGAAVDLLAAGSFVALGASISYFGIDFLDGPDTFTYRIPTRSDMPVPEPVAPATAASTGTSPQTVYSVGVPPLNAMSATAENACSLAGGSYVAFFNKCTLTNAQCVAVGYSGCFDGVQVYVGTATADMPTCGAGYTLDGAGTCTLSDPRAAAPDKACDLANNGTALAKLSNDTDCAALPQQDLDCSTGSCIITGTNLNGRPRQVIVTTGPTGTTITTHDERVIGSTPVIDTRTTQLSPQGIVTTTTGGTQTGTVPTDGTSPTITPPAAGTPVAPSDTTYPTDYARTGEAATAAQTITDADAAWRAGEQQRWQDKLGVAPDAEAIPTQTVDISVTAVPFASNAVCPQPIAFNAFGNDYNVSYQPMCDLMGTMRPLFLAMGAFAAAYVFFQGLKA